MEIDVTIATIYDVTAKLPFRLSLAKGINVYLTVLNVTIHRVPDSQTFRVVYLAIIGCVQMCPDHRV